MLKSWIIGFVKLKSIARFKELRMITKIELASRHLESETLIRWEARAQEYSKKNGKIISSWNYLGSFIKNAILSISLHAKRKYGLETF